MPNEGSNTVQPSIIAGLKTRLNAIPDVKSATAEADPAVIFQNHIADLVVETWMGGRLYIHMFDKAPKVRDLRAILRENTRCGIGTLFLLDDALLPADDSVVKVEDWHIALFALNESWIYTWYVQADQLSIRQVHFAPTVYADEFRVWHSTDFVVEACVVRSRATEEGIRGTWTIGDLASAQYKRRINYERQHRRYHYSTKQTRETPLQAPTDRLMGYYKMLGIERNATEKEVKRAFRQMALRVHPDVSALPRVESEQRIKELNEAYEYIKEFHGWA